MASPAEVRSGITKSQVEMTGVKIFVGSILLQVLEWVNFGLIFCFLPQHAKNVANLPLTIINHPFLKNV